jgi:serine/threonine protein kinase
VIPSEIELPGVIASAELVAARRGSRIWKVILADGPTLALKYATNNAESQGIQASASQLAAREVSVLRHIGEPSYLYASGDTPAGSWLAVEWKDAPTLPKRWQMFREDQQDRAARTSAVVSAWMAAATLHDLHSRGWRHADLQGDHILVPDDGHACLIDFALAQGPANVDIKPHISYRGALAHLSAPEVAAEVLATPEDVGITLACEAEVYTFGAVLFVAWARQWPRDYSREPRGLTLQEIYTVIGDPASQRPMPSGWPRMAGLIAAMLEAVPAKRPTIHEVHADLGQMAGGRT